MLYNEVLQCINMNRFSMSLVTAYWACVLAISVCHRIVNAVPDELYVIAESLEKSNRCVVVTAAVDSVKESNKFPFLIWLQQEDVQYFFAVSANVTFWNFPNTCLLQLLPRN